MNLLQRHDGSRRYNRGPANGGAPAPQPAQTGRRPTEVQEGWWSLLRPLGSRREIEAMVQAVLALEPAPAAAADQGIIERQRPAAGTRKSYERAYKRFYVPTCLMRKLDVRAGKASVESFRALAALFLRCSDFPKSKCTYFSQAKNFCDGVLPLTYAVSKEYSRLFKLLANNQGDSVSEPGLRLSHLMSMSRGPKPDLQYNDLVVSSGDYLSFLVVAWFALLRPDDAKSSTIEVIGGPMATQQYSVVHISSSKVDQIGAGHEMHFECLCGNVALQVLWGLPSPFCPVHACAPVQFDRLKAVDARAHRSMIRQLVVGAQIEDIGDTAVDLAAKILPISYESVGPYSVRIGAARSAFDAGISVPALLALGRWRELPTALGYLHDAPAKADFICLPRWPIRRPVVIQ
jgi:hypothetical protein